MEPDTTQILHPVPAGMRLVLTITEASELLGISRALGYELAARGELPTLRLGRRVVVPRAQLLALVGVSPVTE